MTELGEIFAELGITSYLHEFIEQGFDTWETILDITESDFDALGVKLGHRRKLQRKIANSRGLSSDVALGSPRNTPSDDRQLFEEQKQSGAKPDIRDGTGAAHGAKRKYRRHPKPDENAPERPPSAYVIFSNKTREELKGRNLSFTEIAKHVGENWQNLSPGEKEPYEQQAFSAKERYNHELTEYKKTPHFRDYSQYLAEFKARQANNQQGPDLEVVKRPKLEAQVSTASSGGSSTNTSQLSMENSLNRARLDSSPSNSTSWQPTDGSVVPSPALPNLKAVSLGQPSSSTTLPTVLPGYREAIFASNQQGLPWRDGQHNEGANSQKLPNLAQGYDHRPSHASGPAMEGLNMTGSIQYAHRTGHQSHPPPLLTSESTNRSTSSASTASSAFFTPRTPLEPPLDRALPLPSLYSQKSTGNMENHLAAIRPPSLSPQTTIHISQQSPNAIQPHIDYPVSMAPIRGFTSTTTQSMSGVERPDPRAREYALQHPITESLDPVSALLKAGEIVDRNSRAQQSDSKPSYD
ncbi:hypothetical protein BJ875DRAFT_163164 [Amylocarpus encephaloides]|uniref:HMG box domain-containing protein n=1 Tax=Amylocarpus encephaloides TaxID=45428 RepID=A0A9P7YA94_9HELO|nr:hypothetical protein BJ875DRAFT_163164 [Amylocarpus encephaloides]